MEKEVRLPKLGRDMTQAKITRWLKREGDTVREGEPLYEVETEKVDVEIPSPATGVVVKFLASEGDVVSVDAVVAVINVG